MPELQIRYYRHYGPAELWPVDDLREALEHARWDCCYVEAILVDGAERWRCDPPKFEWRRVSTDEPD